MSITPSKQDTQITFLVTTKVVEQKNMAPKEFDDLCKEYPNYKIEHKGFIGMNSLIFAAYNGNANLVKHIIEIGDSLLKNSQNYYGMTSLFLAAMCQDLIKSIDVSRILILYGADVNLSTNKKIPRLGGLETTPIGAAPLWAAADITHNLGLVKLLLLNNAKINDSGPFLSDKGKNIIKKAIDEITADREKFLTFLILLSVTKKNEITNNKLPIEILKNIYNIFKEIIVD